MCTRGSGISAPGTGGIAILVGRITSSDIPAVALFLAQRHRAVRRCAMAESGRLFEPSFTDSSSNTKRLNVPSLSPKGWVLGLALALVLGACDSPRSELEPRALERAARNTASLSAEASLLTQQVALATVNENFVWTHQRALQDECLKVWADLHKPFPQSLGARHAPIVRVQAQLQMALDRIAAARADSAALGELRARFDELGQEARALREERP
jgi:hypothetical protein